MTFERSLLERIANPEDSIRRLDIDPRRVAESVLRNLRDMLNTRMLTSKANEEYGLPDFNDLITRFPDAIHELRRAIKTCIEKFEPRLNRVIVNYVPDENNPLALRFEINAQLVIGGSVWYETMLDADGRANIRG